jgi:hypothetical protein
MSKFYNYFKSKEILSKLATFHRASVNLGAGPIGGLKDLLQLHEWLLLIPVWDISSDKILIFPCGERKFDVITMQANCKLNRLIDLEIWVT